MKILQESGYQGLTLTIADKAQVCVDAAKKLSESDNWKE